MSRLWAFIKMLPSNIIAGLLFLTLVISARRVEHRRTLVDFILVVLPDSNWLFKFTSWTSKASIDGVTVGSFVYVKESFQNDKNLIRHETIHIEQQERWPVIYFVIYLYYSWDARRRGLDPYRANKFEEEAYRREREERDG